MPHLRGANHVHCGQTEDHKEAAKAFVEKREFVCKIRFEVTRDGYASDAGSLGQQVSPFLVLGSPRTVA